MFTAPCNGSPPLRSEHGSSVARSDLRTAYVPAYTPTVFCPIPEAGASSGHPQATFVGTPLCAFQALALDKAHASPAAAAPDMPLIRYPEGGTPARAALPASTKAVPCLELPLTACLELPLTACLELPLTVCLELPLTACHHGCICMGCVQGRRDVFWPTQYPVPEFCVAPQLTRMFACNCASSSNGMPKRTAVIAWCSQSGAGVVSTLLRTDLRAVGFCRALRVRAGIVPWEGHASALVGTCVEGAVAAAGARPHRCLKTFGAAAAAAPTHASRCKAITHEWHCRPHRSRCTHPPARTPPRLAAGARPIILPAPIHRPRAHGGGGSGCGGSGGGGALGARAAALRCAAVVPSWHAWARALAALSSSTAIFIDWTLGER
eukprot:365796-Chlamydomonas_euryale.AAC.20